MTLAPFHIPEPLEIALDLPFPPSTNAIWRGKGKRGVYLSKDYQAWIRSADASLMGKLPPSTSTIAGPCEAQLYLNIEVGRVGSDIDNRIKAVLDYAQRVGVLDNDKLIMKLTVEWAKGIGGPKRLSADLA